MPLKPKSVGTSSSWAMHRLDPKARLLHRLYEPLVLLWILNPSRRPGELDISVEARSQHFHMFWRRFLDGLCFLCDPEKGGGTVCALATETTPSGPVFWFASTRKEAVSLLDTILQELASLNRQSSLFAQNRVEDLLVIRSTSFCESKAKTYGQFLNKAILLAIKSSKDHGAPSRLMDELETLQKNRQDAHTMVEAAFNFSNHQDLSRLMQQTAQILGRSPWADIHHLIGRLGAWRRIARTLVSFVCHFPTVLHDFAVQFLRVPGPTLAPAADRKTNLESALRRMLSSQEGHRANLLNEALEELRLFDVPKAFEQKYCDPSFMPHVHAEVFLLEHFHSRNMKFLEQDRYLGCSKPSCYCCGLYMRFHPGNVVIRPCSGNIWTNWSPPIEVKPEMNEKEWKHTLDIINAMNAFIRRDVIEEIETRAPRRPRMPDTTTGFSTAGGSQTSIDE